MQVEGEKGNNKEKKNLQPESSEGKGCFPTRICARHADNYEKGSANYEIPRGRGDPNLLRKEHVGGYPRGNKVHESRKQKGHTKETGY